MIYNKESTIIYRASTRIDRMTISKRITQARQHAGLSKTALASVCKISKQAVGQMENGSTKNPQPITLKKIAYACGVSLNWLIDGEGSMVFSEKQETQDLTASELIHGTHSVKEKSGAIGPEATRFALQPIRNVPVITKKEIVERDKVSDLTYEDHKHWCPSRSVGPNSFAISVQDLPTPNDRFGFSPSSLIIIDPDYQLETGNLVLVLDVNNNLSIKRYEIIGNLNYLGSYNENYQPILLDETFQLIGRLAGSYQEF